MSETDDEFVDRMMLSPLWAKVCDDWTGADFTRLFTLARRGAAMQWRPIEEAPRDGAAMLNYFPTYGQPIEVRHFKGHTATHWMPLPPPPAGETND